MKLLLCDPPAPLPGQALAPRVRMGRGSQRVQKRALLGSIWIQEVWSKIEVAAPCYAILAHRVKNDKFWISFDSPVIMITDNSRRGQ